MFSDPGRSHAAFIERYRTTLGLGLRVWLLRLNARYLFDAPVLAGAAEGQTHVLALAAIFAFDSTTP